MLSEFRTYKYKINLSEHSRLALETLTYTHHHGQKSQQQKHVAQKLAVTTLEWHQILG